ncbi:hypothetical protein FKH33_11860 [Salmonella enterica]|nr:hypothetical protein [Salmonella enterica]EAT5833766.1 hypothetical protein [Salmonella enterica]EAU1455636.1 hypothetical protein [Salmonella enterica]EBI0299968.1 hypothetical protein [Salmonella enterica]EBK6199770.1 hypothetical protein [Salmonella enterica]
MGEVNLPKGWAITKLELLTTDISYGYTAPSSSDEVGPKLLRITDIQNNTVVWSDVPYCKIEKEKLEKYLLKKNDLVFARTGATVGKSFLIRTEPPRAVYASYLIRVRTASEELISLLSHFFNSQHYWQQITEFSSGIGQPNVNGTKLRELIIPLPPLAEQKIIADKLDILLAQVEATKARLERIPKILKTFRQSVLAAAVSGKLTNTDFEKEIFKLDSEEWDIPKSWQRVNLHELINTSKPICYGVVQPGDEVEDGKLLIRVCDIYDGEVDYSNLRTISPEVDKQYLRSKVSVGDILVTIVGAIGRIGIVREDIEANIARAVAKISPNFKLVLPMYLHIWLSSPVLQWWLVNSSKEVARKTLNLKELKEALVALPSLDEQAEIVRHVEQLFTFAENIEQKVNSALVRVNNLTQSILAKAFRGEFTANWRSAHPELISGENSANTLLEKIKAERESSKRQPKPKRPTVKKMTGSRMSKQRIKVVEVLKQTGKPLSGQQLLAAAGYPSDSSTDQLEQFFLELRDALTIEKSIVKLERDDDSQDWFALATPSINKVKD